MSPLVVFDLDGTLVDTAPDLVATLNTILAREGLPPVDYEAARNFVGGGARVMVERGFDGGWPKPAGTPRSTDLRAISSTTMPRILPTVLRHFRAWRPALDALADRGYRFAVCTNKIEKLSMLLLDALDLSKRFSAICGADTFGVAKPDPEMLHRTIARADGDGAVMVGDFAHRHRHRPCRPSPSNCGRFRVHGYPCRGAGTRPDHQPFRRPPRGRFGPHWQAPGVNLPGALMMKFTLPPPHLGGDTKH